MPDTMTLRQLLDELIHPSFESYLDLPVFIEGSSNDIFDVVPNGDSVLIRTRKTPMNPPTHLIDHIESDIAARGYCWLSHDEVQAIGEGPDLPFLTAVCDNRDLMWQRDITTDRIQIKRRTP